MASQIWNFFAVHKTALCIAAAWSVRELQQFCKWVVNDVWPFLKANNGINGVRRILFNGDSSPDPKPQPETK